jgi:GTP-binding protein EngB required for normal cell division
VITLQEYERYKFRLAEIIRFASAIDYEHEKGSEQRWRELSARLADDRFNVVVAGRFNRGKSTLMNALLGMERLPTGIMPLTSVITTVRYGTSERVLLEFEGSALRAEAALKDLAEYVTEKGNPGNKRHIRSAEVQLPAEILRRGLFFVDTPGLGSAIFENTETTERYIPEIDVLILVSGYESPLTEDEIRFLSNASAYARSIFVVLNKHDTVPGELRGDVLRYVERIVGDVLKGKARKPFSLSAREALVAKQNNDANALRTSGLFEFEQELVGFLTNQKSEIFLDSMCDRLLAELSEADWLGLEDVRKQVLALQQQVRNDVEGERGVQPTGMTSTRDAGVSDGGHVGLGRRRRLQASSLCEVCARVFKDLTEFMRRYQYELSTRAVVQQRHSENGGFCPLHTWHYEQITSPHGVCASYPALLARLAKGLRKVSETKPDLRSLDEMLPQLHCPACEVRWRAEDNAVQALMARRAKAVVLDRMLLSPLCLPHLRLILARSQDEELSRYLLESEADLLERTAEDMQRYAVRHEALRRALTSAEERNSYLQGLQMLVGHKAVNALFVVRDIL